MEVASTTYPSGPRAVWLDKAVTKSQGNPNKGVRLLEAGGTPGRGRAGVIQATSWEPLQQPLRTGLSLGCLGFLRCKRDSGHVHPRGGEG